MKRWVLVIGVVITIGVLVGGGCGGVGARVVNRVISDQLSVDSLNFKVFKWCTNGLPFVDKFEGLVTNKTYIVVLHNNRELRPTGGFMGSYVRLKFGEKGLSEMKVMDIYQPDGQLPGHVEPPYPVQEAFGQGWWKLRDANWDVDIASAAASIAWFLEQGGEPAGGKVDGVVGINLDLFSKWLAAVSGVDVVTYGVFVDETNLYSLAQEYAELNFKPGATNKRDFLGAVGAALWEKTNNLKLIELIKLVELLREELKKGQVWVWMRDPEIMKTIDEKKWSGRLDRGEGDYLYVVESNLGANKANCCIERSVNQIIEKDNQTVTIDWKNTGKNENPKPPEFWGGNYVDYVRVMLPKEANIVSVSVSGKELRRAGEVDFATPSSLRQGRSENIYVVEQRDGPSAGSGQGLQIVGFWAVVKAGGETEALITYSTPPGPPPSLGGEVKGGYKVLRVNRQPGIESFPYKLIKNGEVIFDGIVDRQRDFGL